MASPTRWTWVWVNSGSWWWTGRPGVLQSMGSQRVRYCLATEQQQYTILFICSASCPLSLLLSVPNFVSWGLEQCCILSRHWINIKWMNERNYLSYLKTMFLITKFYSKGVRDYFFKNQWAKWASLLLIWEFLERPGVVLYSSMHAWCRSWVSACRIYVRPKALILTLGSPVTLSSLNTSLLFWPIVTTVTSLSQKKKKPFLSWLRFRPSCFQTGQQRGASEERTTATFFLQDSSQAV